METPNLSKRIRPFLELLLGATVLFPLGLVLMVLWLGAGCAGLFLPMIGLLNIYAADWGSGLLYIVGGAGAFWIWRLLNRRVWQNPESLL